MDNVFSARIRVAASCTVPASPLQVFHEVSRPDRYGEWWPRAVRFEASPAPLATGSRFGMKGFGARLTLETADVREGEGIWFRIVEGGLAGTCEWLLEPVGAGTRVVFQLRAEPISPWQKFLALLVDPQRLYSLWANEALEGLSARLSTRA